MNKDKNQFKIQLGQRIAEAMKSKGINQTQLASVIGVTPQSVQQWVDGKTSANNTRLQKISKALGVDTSWLLTGDKDYEEIEPDENHQAVRFARFRLEAGINGFAIDYLDEDNEPLYFRKSWFIKRSLKPGKIVACSIVGESMEPTLYSGDVVLIDLSKTEPKDGEVFAVNYEGELVIKRLQRDAGQWYLQSDNTNKTRFPNKLCCGDLCLILGKIVHRQSERL